MFLDHRCLRPGDEWAVELQKAQRDARLTAALVSRRSPRAFYQREEIAQAIELARQNPKRHRLVPIHLHEDTDAPYGLRVLHALHADGHGSMTSVGRELLAVLGIGAPCTTQTPLAGTARPRAAASRQSPLRPGTPLYAGDLLPGESRRQLVDMVAADLLGTTNVNLVGERRLGRTSTLNHAWSKLNAQDGCIVGRVNMQDDVLVPEDFYGAVLRGLARCPRGAELLGAERARQLRRDTRLPYHVLRDALDELRGHTSVIVLVDEFERCFDLPDAFAIPVFYDNVRSLLGGDEQGPYLTAAIATRQALTTYFTRRQVTSSLPSYLPPRTLQALTDADVEEALAQDSPHRLGPVQREQAAALAARHPCCVQCAGEAWYRALAAGRSRQWAEDEFARLSEQLCGGVVIVGEDATA